MKIKDKIFKKKVKEQESKKDIAFKAETILNSSDIDEDVLNDLIHSDTVKSLVINDHLKIDLKDLVLLLNNKSIERIEIDEITLTNNFLNDSFVELILIVISKLSVKKINFDLEPWLIDFLLGILNESTEIGTITFKKDILHSSYLFNSLSDSINNDDIYKSIIEKIGNRQFEFNYNNFSIKNINVLKELLLSDKISFYSNDSEENEFIDIKELDEEDFRKYLKRFKGKKEIFVFGNMIISERILEIIDEELGEITINLVENPSVKDSVKNSFDIDYAVICDSNEANENNGYFNLQYKDISIKSVGNPPKEIGYVYIDGIKDFDRFFPNFNDMTADCHKLFLKTSNKSIPNLDSIYKYEDRMQIKVLYDKPHNVTSNLELENMAHLLKDNAGINLTECSVDDFIGMRETIDWIKNISKEEDMTILGLIFFAYDFVKTFPYKDNNDDKRQAREISSVLNSDYMVCLGYASLFSQILKEFNIKSIVTSTEDHAYCIVRIDDDINDIHGLYRFDPTNDSVYMKLGSQNDGVFTKLYKDNFAYNLAFRTLSKEVTILGNPLYNSSKCEEDMLNFTETGILSSKLLNSFNELFGSQYNRDDIIQYINAKEITFDQFLTNLLMAKQLQGYDFETYFEECYNSAVIWEESKGKPTKTKNNQL